MTHILALFQIKTVRSAWVFLIGSGIMFIFGAYQGISNFTFSLNDPDGQIKTILLLPWVIVTGLYISIASWALYSVKGRSFLESQEQIPIKGNRTILWYIKFLFACYASALATLMLLGVLALPFVGHVVLDSMFSHNSGMYFLLAGFTWSPLIFRHLK